MKLFLDTANVDEIRDAASLGVLDGVTTNPSLVATEGREFEAVLHEICEIVKGPVSGEVTASAYDQILVEARRLARNHENIAVQCPPIKWGIRPTRTIT